MRFLLIIAFLSFSAPARADIAADTDFIVMKQLEATGTQQRLDALSDQAIANLEPGIENFGATIIDREAFKEVLLGDTYDELFEMIRTRWIELYRAHLTPDEVTALADFYRSDANKALEAFVSETGELPPDAYTLLDGPLGPLIEHLPEMEASFSGLEAEISTELSNLFALDRFIEILAMKDIIGFETEARRHEVIEAIEAYLIN